MEIARLKDCRVEAVTYKTICVVRRKDKVEGRNVALVYSSAINWGTANEAVVCGGGATDDLHSNGQLIFQLFNTFDNEYMNEFGTKLLGCLHHHLFADISIRIQFCCILCSFQGNLFQMCT